MLALALAGAGCGDELGECPPSSTDAQNAGAAVVASRCQGCHRSTLQGAARQAAPLDLNFDQLEVVKENAGEMYSEVLAGSMPPGVTLSADERENLRVWLACTATE